MLSERFPSGWLAEHLVGLDEWRPYPTIDDREAWQGLGAEVAPDLLAAAESRSGMAWPSLPAVRYLDFVRDGNRSRYQEAYFGRRRALAELVLGECVEDRGRFLDDIVNGVWAICEESSWCVPAHIGAQRAGPGLPDTTEPVVDLFAAETGALLGWVFYLITRRLDSVSLQVPERMVREIRQRILDPLRERDDFGWMGLRNPDTPVNNWNPWINSNWLTCALLLESDPEGRVGHVVKSLRSLDTFIRHYPADGGCDEGPSYWGRAAASLFDCLELLLSVTGGRLSVYDQSLVQEMGRFIYRVQVCGQYFVNFADAPARLIPHGPLLYGYGLRVGDRDLQALGAWAVKEARTAGDQSMAMIGLGRTLAGLFRFAGAAEAPGRQPLPAQVWLPGTQVGVARDKGGTCDGWFVAVKGGHNAESHNHNDVGSFMVFRDGCPVIVDAGVGTYTRETFSSRRYGIWTMQSAYHSLLPTVDGVMQAPGGQFRATDVSWDDSDPGRVVFRVSFAAAYPADAGIENWQREVVLQRGQRIEVRDSFDFARSPQVCEFAFLTPCAVEVADGGHELVLLARETVGGRRTGSAVVTLDSAAGMDVRVERMPMDDDRLAGVWGEWLSRVVYRWSTPPLTGSLTWVIGARTD